MNARSGAEAQESGFVELTSTQASRQLLIEIARRYKGIDEALDFRIDAAAPLIYGDDRIRQVVPFSKNDNRVPLYFEGEPGVSKTALTRSAARKFCSLVGLNFVEEPDDGYIPGPNDFYFCMVNLSGKNSPVDLGGFLAKAEMAHSEAERKAQAVQGVGNEFLAEVTSKTQAVCDFQGVEVAEPLCYDIGGSRAVELTLKAADPRMAREIAEHIIDKAVDSAKRQGIGVSMLRPDQDEGSINEGRVYYEIKDRRGLVQVRLFAPKAEAPKPKYAAVQLANLRMNIAQASPYSLVLFDDVANAGASLQNVLLEVAQFGRYSGVMDLGRALVSFTGNMGLEDGTNVNKDGQSDAFLTRVAKYRVVCQPEEWADWAMRAYAGDGDIGADCHVASFVEHMKGEDGTFREPKGLARGKKGVPKTNPRTLHSVIGEIRDLVVNVQSGVVGFAGVQAELEGRVAATCGKRTARAFTGYLSSMLTEAIPLAQNQVNRGEFNAAVFHKHVPGGQMATGSSRDFGHRFSCALAEVGVNRVMFSEAAAACMKGDRIDPVAHGKLVSDTVSRMLEGAGHLNDNGLMANCFAKFGIRLANTPAIKSLQKQDNVNVIPAYIDAAITKGIAEAMVGGKLPMFESLDEAINVVVPAITGATLSRRAPGSVAPR